VKRLLVLLLLVGCDGCQQQADPFLWLSWHGYTPESVVRMDPPTIGSWPCEAWQEAWRATAVRNSPEYESDCWLVRATVVICCPATNRGPCHGRETSIECESERR
jgi:hypothetical protein